MRNYKYGQIIGTLMLLLVLTLFAKLSPDQTQTSAGREFLLQEISKDMQIISEIKIKDSIIAEITQGDQTGYALFAKTSGKYKLQQYWFSPEKIDTDAVLINGKSYIVGVCDATEVDSVKIDFTDPDTKKIVESKKVDLQGKKLFVVPSPDVKSYMVTVRSNDKEG